jgi:hypothetical protein
MGKRRLLGVSGTGRRYVDRTRGGWLVGSPIERHVLVRRRFPLLLVAAAILAALLLLVLSWR